jgi:hypothetical protein
LLSVSSVASLYGTVLDVTAAFLHCGVLAFRWRLFFTSFPQACCIIRQTLKEDAKIARGHCLGAFFISSAKGALRQSHPPTTVDIYCNGSSRLGSERGTVRALRQNIKFWKVHSVLVFARGCTL